VCKDDKTYLAKQVQLGLTRKSQIWPADFLNKI